MLKDLFSCKTVKGVKESIEQNDDCIEAKLKGSSSMFSVTGENFLHILIANKDSCNYFNTAATTTTYIAR